MKKKLLSLIVGISMMAALTGCGGNEVSNDLVTGEIIETVKEAGKIQEIRVAVGSAAPTVRNCVRTASCLKEGGVSAMEEAKRILMEEIAPIDDRWATAEYRRMVACNMLESLAVALMEEKNV